VGDGIDLTKKYGGGVPAVIPVLRAPVGETFTGAGVVRAWLYVPLLSKWIRAPRADDDLADLAGLNEGVLPTIPIMWTQGRFALVFEGAGLSGGTAPEIDLVAVTTGGEAA
jgi:hypothetical protein